MSKAYTVKFGPWLPDLNNVGVEMPFQWTETELPCADCLNVYYQDSSYRCLPSLASFGPTLGTPVLDAFSWYDNAGGKEIVFAATANGFSQLIDGTWTQIPLQVNASAGTVGLAVSLALGSPFATAVWVTPSSQSASTDASSYTFPANTFHVGNGTPSAYSWAFSGSSGPGSWSIASGGTSATPTVEVTGATTSSSAVTLTGTATINGNTYSASATFSYAVVASVTNTYTNQTAQTLTIPSGYSSMEIEAWGPGGHGGQGYGTPVNGNDVGGGGGGAGGYTRITETLTSADWGKTLAISATNGTAATTVSSGTYAISTLTANSGVNGGAASADTPGTGGAGGTASGGSVNTTGGTGGTGVVGGAGGTGAPATSGVNGGPYGAGGNGGAIGSSSGTAGGVGGVVVKFT